MAPPRIVSVATAVPAHRYTQEQALQMAGYTDSLYQGFFRRSEIDGRNLWLEPERTRLDESIDELQARFEIASRELALQAARTCLRQVDRRPDEIDFLATTTCTGRLCPSIDARLIRDLGMRADVQRVHVGDTGCASAMVALQQATNYLAAHPGHRALVVPVEICSAAYYLDDEPVTAVANAIFADGAAAALLECGREGTDNRGDQPTVEIVAHHTRLAPHYIDKMGFTYPGGRPRILLSKEIRQIAARMVRDLSRAMLDHHRLVRDDIRFWVLHSAGRRVLEAAADLLDFGDGELRWARQILKKFGNISSATVLFVLKEVLDSGEPQPGDRGIMMALGPGFAAEGLLLRW